MYTGIINVTATDPSGLIFSQWSSDYILSIKLCLLYQQLGSPNLLCLT